MKLTDLCFALLLGALLVPASVASADTLTVGSGWQYFQWSNCTSPPCPTSPATWTLNLTAATGVTELRIVDAFTAGDMFQVTVNPYPPPSGQLVTPTSWVPLTTHPEWIQWNYYSPLHAQDDPDAAWSVGKYFSRLLVSLPAGTGAMYTITISVIQLAHDPKTYAPIPIGGAYIRATCVGPVGTGCPADTVSPLSRPVTIPPFTINGGLIGVIPKPQ